MELQTLKDFIEELNDNQKEDFIHVINKYKEDEKNKTGYEKPKVDESYWCINSKGSVEKATWSDDHIDKDYYRNGNAYTVKEVAEADARADKLLRKLRRFAKLKNQENAPSQDRWIIVRFMEGSLRDNIQFGIVYSDQETQLGGIYFSDLKAAQEAIEIYKTELVWYFKDYLLS